jgi:hypothetical protein
MQSLAKSNVVFDYGGEPTTETTLYELIEAITEELDPAEDRLVPKILLHLVLSGQIRFLSSIELSDS